MEFDAFRTKTKLLGESQSDMRLRAGGIPAKRTVSRLAAWAKAIEWFSDSPNRAVFVQKMPDSVTEGPQRATAETETPRMAVASKYVVGVLDALGVRWCGGTVTAGALGSAAEAW